MAKKKAATAAEMTTVAPEQAPAPDLICIKGFDADFKCRGMQYAVGQTYEHPGKVKICESGLHAVEYPLDVFAYYPPAGSRFAVVRASGSIDRKGDGDTKIASARLTVEAEIGIPELVSRAIEWITSRCSTQEGGHATGDRGAASATGYQGAASATGYQGAASATGYQGAASATGDQGAASATGYQGAASATGDQGAASATGDRGAASATGYQGAASATGDRGAASATGKHSVAVSVGFYGRAKARAGSAIVVCHRADDGAITHIRAAVAGRDGVKPDVWYSLDASGQFVEVTE